MNICQNLHHYWWYWTDCLTQGGHDEYQCNWIPSLVNLLGAHPTTIATLLGSIELMQLAWSWGSFPMANVSSIRSLTPMNNGQANAKAGRQSCPCHANCIFWH